MAIFIRPVLANAKQILKQQYLINKKQGGVPKGYIPVYVGEKEADKKRYVVPLSYLSHPAFQHSLQFSEQEYGYSHPMGALTIPCTEETFFDITSALNC